VPTLALPRPDGPVLEVSIDDGEGPIALLGHGAGSTPTFVRACLAGPLRTRGWRMATWEMRGHGKVVLRDPTRLGIEDHAADLGALADAIGARHVGGISLGAHAAVAWAATQPADRLDGLLVVCPAWTGEPDEVADLNRRQAEELERLGLQGALEAVDASAPPWMAAEVRDWWSRHDFESLCQGLRTLSGQPAPTLETLSRIRTRTGVAVLADDGLHPADVGRTWAGALGRAAVAETTIDAVGADRRALGWALLSAWDQA
jgi:pimeloyl-ACP methyl ester carboxylesterase